MADPPSEVGAVHDTTDDASAFEVAVTPVGAPGTVAGPILSDVVAVFCVLGFPVLVSRTTTVTVDGALFVDGVPVIDPVVLPSFNPLGSLAEPTASFHV
ncbi:MAG: hypothetical protein WCI26_09920 [Acidimicrobiales bacterium]